MSPYGVNKDLGGDSPENTQWMETCVRKVMGRKNKNGSPIQKDQAIAICKSTLQKSQSSEKAEAKINFMLDLLDELSKTR
jgi:hypothetical protein